MADFSGRRLASLVLLVLAALGLWFYGSLPGWAPRAASGKALPNARRIAAYHGLVESSLTPKAIVGSCAYCHGRWPHVRTRGQRAFLNLHTASLDCGVCHLSGSDLSIRVEEPGKGSGKATGPRVFAERPKDGSWVRVLSEGEGAALQAAGGGCRDCHRRGSPILEIPGLCDPYRKRVLEDLAVLRWTGGG